jgi:hypothetical protein
VRPITAVLGERYLFFSFRPSTIQATTDLSAWSPVFTPGGTGFTRMAVGDVP